MASEKIREHVALRPVHHDQDVEQNTSNVQAFFKTHSSAVKWLLSVKAFFKTHSSAVIWLLSVMAVAFDPFFFYIPVVKNASTCLGFDNNLRIVIVVLRTFVDVLHTILWWYHSWPLLKKPYEGRKSQKYLIIRAPTVAILAILPLPQVVIFAVSWQLLTVKRLKFIVLIQFFIRLYRIIPDYNDARESFKSGTSTLFAAAFNFIMYTIASNVLGAFWYLRAVERNMDCWKGVCHQNRTLCVGSSLYCDHTSRHNGFLHKHCSIHQASSAKSFDYGIYEEAFQTIITEKDIHFLDKFWQCFWWGLRNMSSYGQNLKTGSYGWDTFFAVVIATCGLILFAFFIGNMQTYLQRGAMKDFTDGSEKRAGRVINELEKMKQILQKRHLERLEEWNPFGVLPDDLKEKVTLCEDRRWLEITEVNLESLLHNIPIELSKEVKSCLCKDMFKKVRGFAHLNEQLLEELCNHAKPIVYPERSYILREGDLITEIILVLRGDSFSYTERDRNEVDLRLHQASKDSYLFFGLELIQHWLPSQTATTVTSTSGHPIAPRTIKAFSKVEAFVIFATDLNSVYNLYGSWGII